MSVNQHRNGYSNFAKGFIFFISKLSTFSGWIAAAMIMAAVLITCQMIYIRSILNLSTVWQTEAVVYLMIAATLMGLSYVQLLRGHVNVDLIPLLLPVSIRKLLYLFTLSLSALIIVVMMIYGYEHWYLAFERNWTSDTVWGVKLWIPYLVLPIGFFLFFLQLIADLVAFAIGQEHAFGIEEK